MNNKVLWLSPIFEVYEYCQSMGCPSTIDCTNLTESNTIIVLLDVVGIGVSKAVNM